MVGCIRVAIAIGRPRQFMRRITLSALLILHTLLPLGIFVFDDIQRPAAHELILRTTQCIQRGGNCTTFPIDRIGSILVMIHVTIIQMLQIVVVNGKNRLIGLFWIIRLRGYLVLRISISLAVLRVGA